MTPYQWLLTEDQVRPLAEVSNSEERVFTGANEMFSRGAIRSVFVEVYFRQIYERIAAVLGSLTLDSTGLGSGCAVCTL